MAHLEQTAGKSRSVIRTTAWIVASAVSIALIVLVTDFALRVLPSLLLFIFGVNMAIDEKNAQCEIISRSGFGGWSQRDIDRSRIFVVVAAGAAVFFTFFPVDPQMIRLPLLFIFGYALCRYFYRPTLPAEDPRQQDDAFE